MVEAGLPDPGKKSLSLQGKNSRRREKRRDKIRKAFSKRRPDTFAEVGGSTQMGGEKELGEEGKP